MNPSVLRKSLLPILTVAMLILVVAPTTSARADPPTPPPYGVCVKGVNAADCWDGRDVCVGFSYQIPQCADVPCYPMDCIAVEKPDLPPLVSACVKGVTASDCYRHNDACVQFSLQVPQCVDVPCYPESSCVAAGPECMDRYWRADVGPVSVVSRSSCEYTIYINGEPLGLS